MRIQASFNHKNNVHMRDKKCS